MHEILAKQLTTLLERMELRDLVDVGALLAQGGDLNRALAEAPRHDAGFSPLALAWLLSELPIVPMAKAADLSPAEVPVLLALRDDLLKRITSLAEPER